MSDRAKAEWRKVTRELAGSGVITAVDAAVLRCYCDAVARYEDAVIAYANSTALVRSRGGLITNPLARIVRDSADQVRLFARELGLSPAARANLSLSIGPEVADTLLRSNPGPVFGWSATIASGWIRLVPPTVPASRTSVPASSVIPRAAGTRAGSQQRGEAERSGVDARVVNATVKTDQAGARIVKSSRGQKIDLAVAAVIAYDRARARREVMPRVEFIQL